MDAIQQAYKVRFKRGSRGARGMLSMEDRCSTGIMLECTLTYNQILRFLKITVPIGVWNKKNNMYDSVYNKTMLDEVISTNSNIAEMGGDIKNSEDAVLTEDTCVEDVKSDHIDVVKEPELEELPSDENALTKDNDNSVETVMSLSNDHVDDAIEDSAPDMLEEIKEVEIKEVETIPLTEDLQTYTTTAAEIDVDRTPSQYNPENQYNKNKNNKYNHEHPKRKG